MASPKERIEGGLGKAGGYGELAEDKFIFVFQDIRGRFGSEGEFVNLRRSKTKADGVDEATDTYDSIDWLVKNLPDNNGKVGVFGVSYGGWTAAIATINPHPALKAVTSQASPEDMFIGDDFLHNGAFRLDYAWSWVSALETDGRTMNAFDFGTDDAYDWYLKQTDLANMDQRLLGRAMPSWQNFVSHPNYDSFWREQPHLAHDACEGRHPNLIVAGWWDQEDFYGPMKSTPIRRRAMIARPQLSGVGPWNHGGWRGEGSTYGPFELGGPTGQWFRATVELPWFRYWLKGEGKLDQPEALVFQSGSNLWQRQSRWPARRGRHPQPLSACGRQALVRSPQRGEADQTASFRPGEPGAVSRPRDIEAVHAAGLRLVDMDIRRSGALRAAQGRAVLADRAAGPDMSPSRRHRGALFASTTGSDADWVVKLVDVYPSDAATPANLRGRQRMIANDVFPRPLSAPATRSPRRSAGQGARV
jgi:putative CocE/NonD family hydrolase